MSGRNPDKVRVVRPPRPRWKLTSDGFSPDPTHDAEFKAKLREFRGNDDTTPNKGLRSGEGQLFRGTDPLLALKRWFQSRIGDMAKSLSLLRDAKAQVDGNPVLSRTIDVVKVGDRGSDWAIRDFDPSSVELKAAGDGAPQTARANAIAELERLKAEGSLTDVLADLLKKLKKEPPSANLHWSPSKGKILVIDMQ